MAAAAPPSDAVDDPAHVSRQPSIRNINFPPSREELKNLEDVPLHELPRPYKRADGDRVFCNRSISLSTIKHYGFDMDYTLAVYKSPQIYEMVYMHAAQRLVQQGYPEALLETSFRAELGIRGLFFDRLHGNLLMVDSFNNIMRAMHGTRPLKAEELDQFYPSRYIPPGEMPNYFMLDTLFHVPEACLLATVVDLFDRDARNTPLPSRTGVQVAQSVVSYAGMQADIRESIDYVHRQGLFKKSVLGDLDSYVERDARLPLLLLRMRQNGCKVFLATNSDFTYTNAIMTHLFDVPLEPGMPTLWRDYFDVVVVSACKPLFFEEGTMLREVDVTTGKLVLGQFIGSSGHGRVLAGGSSRIVSDLLGSRGDDVLYVGDSIFGDVLKSKKLRGWRTLLVVPELKEELEAFHRASQHVVRLKNLEYAMAETFRDLDSRSVVKPDVKALNSDIERTLQDIERCHISSMGGLFRCVNQETFFAMQTRRYADLYAATCINLINYPLFYEYRSHELNLPHEDTGSHSAWSMHFPPIHPHGHGHGHGSHSRSSSRAGSGSHLVPPPAAGTAATPVGTSSGHAHAHTHATSGSSLSNTTTHHAHHVHESGSAHVSSSSPAVFASPEPSHGSGGAAAHVQPSVPSDHALLHPVATVATAGSAPEEKK